MPARKSDCERGRLHLRPAPVDGGFFVTMIPFTSGNKNARLPMLMTVALVLVSPLASGSLGAAEPLSARILVPYTERVETGFIDWGQGLASVDVQASYDTVRFGSSHAKIKSIGEAEKKGDAALFRLLRGINVDGERRLAGNPDLEAALKRIIPKSRKMDIGKIANVTLNATFTVPLGGKKAVAGAVHSTIFAESTEHGMLDGAGGGPYTSVLFDASKTSLQAALFPRFRTESGELVYGPGLIDAKALARGAAIRYVVRSDDTGKKKSGLTKDMARALGDNPLVVEIGKIAGEFLADIVLRDEQVEQLRQARVGDLLSQGLVFILQTRSIDTTR